MSRPAIIARLIDADLVALGYGAFGCAFGALSMLLAWTDAPGLFVYSYSFLSVLLLACSAVIERAARPGVLISPVGRDADAEDA